MYIGDGHRRDPHADAAENAKQDEDGKRVDHGRADRGSEKEDASRKFAFSSGRRSR